VVQGSVRLKAFMNTVIKLRFHNIFGYSWVAAQLAASQEGLSSIELVV
jgi:hypothetical protein